MLRKWTSLPVVAAGVLTLAGVASAAPPVLLSPDDAGARTDAHPHRAGADTFIAALKRDANLSAVERAQIVEGLRKSAAARKPRHPVEVLDPGQVMLATIDEAKRAGYAGRDLVKLTTAVHKSIAAGVRPQVALAVAQQSIAERVDATHFADAMRNLAAAVRGGAFSDIARAGWNGPHPKYAHLSDPLVQQSAERFAAGLADGDRDVAGAITDAAGAGASFWAAMVNL